MEDRLNPERLYKVLTKFYVFVCIFFNHDAISPLLSQRSKIWSNLKILKLHLDGNKKITLSFHNIYVEQMNKKKL